MKHLKPFNTISHSKNNIISEAFLDYYPFTEPTDSNTINLAKDAEFKSIIYSEPTKENIAFLNKLLSPNNKKNRERFITLYHGTSPNIDVLSEGLLATSGSRKKSLQSSEGYVYLSIYPSMAKTFGNLAYGINNSVVYEVKVPIYLCRVDKDQLRNKRQFSNLDIEENIGSSILYGSGVCVKGSIPPYWIKKYDI